MRTREARPEYFRPLTVFACHYAASRERPLGMLYHGCDDVADVRELPRLGGGGDEDLFDSILALPAALAIESDASIRAV